MKGSAAVSQVKVSADGQGVVSHAGVGMLREVAELSGLSAQVTAALADTYNGPWIHAPGDVFADPAAALCLSCLLRRLQRPGHLSQAASAQGSAANSNQSVRSFNSFQHR